MNSIKKQIIARVLQRCEALVNSGLVRKSERKQGLFLSESVEPALHVVIGDETQIAEDSRGYTMRFPLAFQFIFSETRDGYSRSDDFEAEIQKLIEADEQLLQTNGTGLCSKITYEGSTPVINEEQKPNCLTIVMFQLEYRRAKAQPDVSY